MASGAVEGGRLTVRREGEPRDVLRERGRLAPARRLAQQAEIGLEEDATGAAPEHRVAAAVDALSRVHGVNRAAARRRRGHDPEGRGAAVRECHLRPVRRPGRVRVDREIAGARHRTCEHRSKNRHRSNSNRDLTPSPTASRHHATTIGREQREHQSQTAMLLQTIQ